MSEYPKVSKENIKGSKIQWSETNISEDKCTFLFTIRNFSLSLLNKKNGESISSPTFTMEQNTKIRWYLKLYPNGENEKSLDRISLFLHPNFNDPTELKACYVFAIVGKDKKNHKLRNITYTFDEEKLGFGYACFVVKDDLLEEKENLLPNDTLTIFCSIVAGIHMNTNSKTIPLSDLEDNAIHISKKFKPDTKSNIDILEKMYSDKTYFDVTFIVDYQEIFAHKSVLAAASPILAEIFSKGKKTSKLINISDVSFEIMNELVRFVYTKRISNLQDIADQLIVAANKYSIEDLKSICEETLGKSINLENVLKLFVIAKENNAETLKNFALNFIINNKKKLGKKSEFQIMIESHSEFLKEIFLSEINRISN